METLRHIIRSTILWAMFFTVSLFLFLMFGARPLLHCFGVVLGWMGGPGLDGTNL